MSQQTSYARKSEALWRRVADEVLLADPEVSEIERLSIPASALWLLLDRPRTRDDLTRELAAEFEIPPDDIAGHVGRLLDELSDRGWLEVAPSDA